jgi:salicylate hydroxylase
MTKLRVLIAGAGIGGLACAVALLRRGFDVEMFEKVEHLGEVGAGIQISPNGMRVLVDLGLEEEIRQAYFIPTTREMRLWNTGDSSRASARSAEMTAKFGYPHCTLHRADLHTILLSAAQKFDNFSLRLTSSVAAFEQDADGVMLRLADGRQFTGDVLIGADGIHSAIRHELFGVSGARFTGGLAWRGTIPIETLPPSMRERTGQTWCGPTGHFVVYPIRRGELINVVGHVDRSDWQVESWFERGDPAEFLRDFEGWHEEIQVLIKSIAEPFKWALFLHDTLPRWSVGRVTLLGDACHPMVPYLAQGANQALEDGIVLARCLETFDDVTTALQRYDAIRIPRSTRVVNESAANQKRFHDPALADPEAGRAYLDRAWRNQMELRTWVFEYDPVNSPLDAPATSPPAMA